MTISSDEAIAIGCKKFRDIYPKGLIPPDLEENGVLGAGSSDTQVTVHVTYWIEGEKDPFYLFRASVDRACGAVNVEVAEDWHILEKLNFSQSRSL